MLRICVCLLFISVPLAAWSASDVNRSSDHKSFERFPASYIVQYNQEYTRDYRWILGGLEKVNGVLRAEKEQRLKGELTQVTYRIPETHTAEAAFEHFYTQAIRQGGEVLFRCTGRECGSSNQWANNIFGYFRLYGIDRSQSFASLKLGNSHISLYSVKRGSKRVYLRLDVLETTATSLESSSDKTVQISREITPQDDLSYLVEYLQKNPNASIWVVAYDFNPGSKQAQIQRAREQSQQIKTQLLLSGANDNQVNIYAVGSFSLDSQFERGTKLMVYSENRVE